MVEVGLGGRLDATNVVTPVLSVITPMDFDHEALMGRQPDAIAAEKAGILKPGVPAVLARQRPEAAQVMDRRAAQLSMPVSRLAGWKISELELTRGGQPFPPHRRTRARYLCPLAGEHQVDNAATAAVALTRLGVSDAEIEDGIAVGPLAGPAGTISRASRNHRGRRAQPGRRSRAGRLHRPFLREPPSAPDLWRDAR